MTPVEEKTTALIKGITSGQIGRLLDRFSECCRINRQLLPKDAVQEVLEEEGNTLSREMFEVFLAHVERHVNTIVIRVHVNRHRTPKEALDATKCRQYTGSAVFSMSNGEGDDVEVVFFKVGRSIDEEELEKEYEARGLKPADAYSVAAVNEANPDFSIGHPNGTHWKDAQERWCFIAFSRWGGEESVDVEINNHTRAWNHNWWLAGRK
jgi:hypothetical protein